MAVYRHCDIDHLDALLAGRGDRRAVVVSDTVFSMDGDAADVAALTATAARHGALLVLDEAHAVLGPHPRFDPTADVLRVGTLSKTLGALGGFVAGPPRYVELVENVARPYIFTTALSPADAAARAPHSACWSPRKATRSSLASAPRRPAARGVIRRRSSPSSAATRRAPSTRPRAPRARPARTGDPTADRARGTSRLRVALSAAHTDAQLDRLEAALLDVFGVLPTQ